jgi:hypothetical protein
MNANDDEVDICHCALACDRPYNEKYGDAVTSCASKIPVALFAGAVIDGFTICGIATFDAEVINPCALTVTTEIFDEPPYVPAVTPVFAKSAATTALFAIAFVFILDNGMTLFILYSV